MLRITVICSSGGSAFATVAKTCDDVRFRVIADRECAVEARCRELNVPCVRIEEPDNGRFSQLAVRHIERGESPDFVMLFFSRLVTEPLLGRWPILNIHPSLLPAFPGMGGARRAWKAGCRYLGATLHVVDAGVDTGPIIGQACRPIEPEVSLARVERYSFLQKVSLFLLAIDLWRDGTLQVVNGKPVMKGPLSPSANLNPALRDPRLARQIEKLELGEGLSL